MRFISCVIVLLLLSACTVEKEIFDADDSHPVPTVDTVFTVPGIMEVPYFTPVRFHVGFMNTGEPGTFRIGSKCEIMMKPADVVIAGGEYTMKQDEIHDFTLLYIPDKNTKDARSIECVLAMVNVDSQEIIAEKPIKLRIV